MTELISGPLSAAVGFISQILPKTETVIIKEVTMRSGSNTGTVFLRLAGVSGAIAVALGAYGAHVFRHSEADQSLKTTFETGNRYHFMHTLALLAIPLSRRPMLSGTLLTTGMVLFSGSCYYHALTANTAVRKVTPYGGLLLIAGWISLAL